MRSASTTIIIVTLFTLALSLSAHFVQAQSNTFTGQSAGANNTTGYANSFYGLQSGTLNSVGYRNSFFGATTGLNNSTGAENSFFGNAAGISNTTGSANSFFGGNSGGFNTTGNNNAFFGWSAGRDNTNGGGNSFFGFGAGTGNTTGTSNVYVGNNAAFNSTSGSYNTVIGANAVLVSGNLNNATAIGFGAAVGQSNSLVLGSISGVNGASVNTNVGIGTSTPAFRLDLYDRMRIKQNPANSGPNNSAGLWLTQTNPNSQAFVGMQSDTGVGFYGNTAGWGLFMNINTGVVTINNMGAPGIFPLCRNLTNEISNCSSSIRYKTDVVPFTSGLDLIRQLQPVSFHWIQGDQLDFGLVAEDVARVEPLLATYNTNGEVEGVKYDRLGVVLINAVSEQQLMIKNQQAEIGALRSELAELKKLVCAQNTAALQCQQ